MSHQLYYGHGKLLLTSEYFVLDGAKAIALPSKLGQKMYVKYRPSNEPKLYWKSFDHEGNCWLEAKFELWHFDILNKEATKEVTVLQKILRQARKQNIHFLRDEHDIYVETKIEFPLEWGLGSSSTLIYNIAQWAYISPFELLSQTFKGSGYDIACAQSLGPITYEVSAKGPLWETVNFDPHFKNNLYFLFLNKKQNSRDGIAHYREQVDVPKKEIVERLTSLSTEILSAINLKEFEELLLEHERLVSEQIKVTRIQDLEFQDFWGVVKSLGAWGGDFTLVTSDKDYETTREYFSRKGFKTLLKFDELILQDFKELNYLKKDIEMDKVYEC